MRETLPAAEFSEDPPREILERQYGKSDRVQIIPVLVRLEPDERRSLQLWVYQQGGSGIRVGQDDNLRNLLESRPKGDQAAGYYWAYFLDGRAEISGIGAPPWGTGKSTI